MSERSCNTCLYQNINGDCVAEQCNFDMSGWRPSGRPNSFAEQIKAALPKEEYAVKYFGAVDDAGPLILPDEKFSLDKLIDDHWNYTNDLMAYCLPYGVDGWETDDILRLVEFVYKQSGIHFWKHCKEHYNIEGESNE